jgi:hypothetical protein
MPMVYSLAPTIEAESLLGAATVTGGELRTQDMTSFGGRWSNNAQLWWVEANPGDKLTLPITAPADGEYELVGFFTRAGDYGIFRTSLNGRPIGSLVDGYSNKVEPTGPVSFGQVQLKRGVNNLVIELIGKEARSAGYSNGYLVGIDGFQLNKE